MDILLAQLTQFLSSLLMPLVLGGVVAIVAYAVLAHRGMLNGARKRRLRMILGLTALTYMLSFFCAELLLDHYANRRLATLADRSHVILVIHGDGHAIRIKDSKAIRQFLSVIGGAQRIGAHHSHPVHELILDFPEAGYTYSLGIDSEGKDEYWLTWLSHPDSSQGMDFITVVRQFRSKQLSEWLRRHVPWDTVPSI